MARRQPIQPGGGGAARPTDASAPKSGQHLRRWDGQPGIAAVHTWIGFKVTNVAFRVPVRDARTVLADKTESDIERLVKVAAGHLVKYHRLPPPSVVPRDQALAALVLYCARHDISDLAHVAHDHLRAALGRRVMITDIIRRKRDRQLWDTAIPFIKQGFKGPLERAMGRKKAVAARMTKARQTHANWRRALDNEIKRSAARRRAPTVKGLVEILRALNKQEGAKSPKTGKPYSDRYLADFARQHLERTHRSPHPR